MKHWLVIFILVILGERWELAWNRLSGDGGGYQRVYVIGEVDPVKCVADARKIDRYADVVLGDLPKCSVEKFTIPVPGVPLKTMTKEEAEKANKELAK